MSKTPQVALTIAGSDSSGGAGIQADLKVFSAFDLHGASAITAVTAQNTTGVKAIHQVPFDIIEAQLEMVLSDLDVKAVKIGMIGAPEVAPLIARKLQAFSITEIIVDTPLYTTTGASLGGAEIGAALIEHLFPVATLITPNLREAALLLEQQVAHSVAEMQQQAEALYRLGARAVLVKGGHLRDEFGGEENSADQTDAAEAIDVFYDGTVMRQFSAPFVDVAHTHGTGCALSSAIAALMVKGYGLTSAIQEAKDWLSHGLQNSADMGIGAGSGPVKIVKMPYFDQ